MTNDINWREINNALKPGKFSRRAWVKIRLYLIHVYLPWLDSRDLVNLSGLSYSWIRSIRSSSGANRQSNHWEKDCPTTPPKKMFQYAKLHVYHRTCIYSLFSDGIDTEKDLEIVLEINRLCKKHL